MRRLLVLPILVGCSGPEPSDDGGELGRLHLCLVTDAGEAAPTSEVDAVRRWDLAGTVTALEAGDEMLEGPASCWMGRGRFVEFRDEAGATWRLGVVATEAHLDRTPAFDLSVGDTIEVTFVHKADFADDRAVVVTDADGIVFAGEEGFGARLHDVDYRLLRGLIVQRGESDRTHFYQDECGRFAAQTVLFRVGMEQRVELRPWQAGTVFVDGTTLEVRNVGAFGYIGQVDCTDTWGPAPWILWR